MTQEDINSLDSYDALELAQDSKTPNDTLDMLSKHECLFVRYDLASNRDTHAYILDKLSQDESEEVRYSVALNPSTPASALKKLSEDEDEYVRRCVAKNPNAPAREAVGIVCVGFDGTLCENAYPSIGAPQEGAKATMQALHEAGYYLIIWTCRTGALALEAVNWLLEQGIPFDRINDHNPDNLRKYAPERGRRVPADNYSPSTQSEWVGKKVYADVYIDDRNLGGFPGWQAVADALLPPTAPQ